MTSTDARSPFRRPGFIAAAIVIGVITLAGVIVLATSLFGGGNDTADPIPNPSTSSPVSPSASNADASVCGLDGLDEENTLTAAPTNEWELIGTVASPTASEGAGPGSVDDGFRTCFAHTAEGALFAAVNFVALSTDSRNTSQLYELIVEGPARDAAEAAGPTEVDPSGSRLQIAGFKVDSYSKDEATIDIAWTVTSENNSLVSVPTVLRWENGDWKVVITENGAPIAPGPIDNLGGYIPWAGV